MPTRCSEEEERDPIPKGLKTLKASNQVLKAEANMDSHKGSFAEMEEKQQRKY